MEAIRFCCVIAYSFNNKLAHTEIAYPALLAKAKMDRPCQLQLLC